MTKYLREIKRAFAAANLSIQNIDARRKHLHIYYTNGDRMFRVVASKTPSDFRTFRNTVACAIRQTRAC